MINPDPTLKQLETEVTLIRERARIQHQEEYNQLKSWLLPNSYNDPFYAEN